MKGSMAGGSAKELWDEALSIIQQRVPKPSFDAWFRPLALEGMEDGRVGIMIPNRFFKEWFEDHYAGLLKSTLEDLLFTKVEVSLRLPDSEAAAAAAREETTRRPPRRPRDDNSQFINPRYTFETFVVGSSNQFAHAASLAVAEQPSKAYNPLFLYGGVGLGKTHLLHAIGHLVTARDARMRISYVSSEKFTNDLINAIRFDTTVEFRNRYRSLDVLLIDDIQFIAGKERTAEEFFHTFNDLYESGKQIVISSDSLPREIPTLEERLRSRFEWGLIADIQVPDLETKAAILRRKSQAEGVRLPDEVSLYIAKNVRSNIRELEGSLVRILAYAHLNKREINLALAEEVLKELRDDQTRSITMTSIQKSVADYYNVHVEDLKSRARNRSVVGPRQVAMYLCRRHTHKSFPEIGEAFGGKDHTTVIYAVEKVERRIKVEEQLRKQVEELVALISA